MNLRLTRRSWLASFAASPLAAQKPVPRAKTSLPRVGEFTRYVDAQTENPVTRLTTLASANFLPPTPNRVISDAEKYLVFASDRGGSLAPFAMDLRSGQARPLADTLKLDLASLQLSSNGRQAYFIDTGKLMELSVQSRRARLLEENVTSFCAGAGVTDYAFVRGGKLFYAATRDRVWAEGVGRVIQMRPRQTGCIFEGAAGQGSAGDLFFVAFAGAGASRPIFLAKGQMHSPCWSPDGRTVLFLREVPSKSGSEVEIHEVEIASATKPETTVARTSRYATFSPNSDATVFVGASASKAQPSVALLVRSAGRELILCEHRAKNAANVNPCFSPDNRRVYFASDFQGRAAIYALNVERLVEPASE